MNTTSRSPQGQRKGGPRSRESAADFTKQATAIRRVEIAKLLRDPRYQVRQGTDESIVARYANVLAAVVDGWHRIEAHEQRGIEWIEAEIIPEATEREALWLAAEANLSHGLPLKPKEVRKAFQAFIKARKHVYPTGGSMGYRDMAQALGGLVRHTTIRNWTIRDFPKLARRMAEGEKIAQREGQMTDEEATYFNAAKAAIDAARKAANGVRNAERRGELIAEAEATLTEMKAKRDWTLPKWDDVEF